ncbi:hypothetical protein PoB_004842300 [Plakobranchus ocellatus]|uniref:Uncharacterized protein n=1 Tax=Plakobranchus ocellatus TaxID=259542 RepID=A0AAV4BRZ1_9GAST|nr:hypothetical protein PoB_004842300 [Plakobranchus ocellatus]
MDRASEKERWSQRERREMPAKCEPHACRQDLGRLTSDVMGVDKPQFSALKRAEAAKNIYFYEYTGQEQFLSVVRDMTTGSGGLSGRAVGYQVRGPGFESQSEPNQFIIAPPCPCPPSSK